MNFTFITLFGLFVAFLTLFITLSWAKRKQEKLKNIDFHEDLDLLLEKHLDELVIIFKNQIPMANMFLTPPLVLKLKTKTKEEMLKMVPELKTKIFSQLKTKAKLTKSICFLALLMSVLVILASGVVFFFFGEK